MKFRTASGRSTDPHEARSAPVPAAATEPARRGPSDLTRAWANHFSSPQYSVEGASQRVVGPSSEKRLSDLQEPNLSQPGTLRPGAPPSPCCAV